MSVLIVFFFHATATPEIYTLSLHDALPILRLYYRTLGQPRRDAVGRVRNAVLVLHGTGGSGAQFLSPLFAGELRSEEHTSELQSHSDLVCRLLLEKKNKKPVIQRCTRRQMT